MSRAVKSGIHCKNWNETVVKTAFRDGVLAGERCGALLMEGNELLAILANSLETAKTTRV